jgi:SAM-dependent methyltransferase
MTATLACAKARAMALPRGAVEHSVPPYLTVHYWWAYVHPKAVKLFERQWLVNLILWGNYAQLRDAALTELPLRSGRTLQVACVYGDLTNRLAQQAACGGGAVDVIDVLPIQLKNLRGKLAANAPVRLLEMDSADLRLPDAIYDQALIFFRVFWKVVWVDCRA